MTKQQWKMNSKVGPLYLLATENGLCGLSFEKHKAPFVKNLNENSHLSEAVKQLEEYFEGKRKEFKIKLDVEGTDFQKQVWKKLALIPYGKTYSYKDIAKQIKNEKAMRAVGSANGKNPVGIIVPCHRVIAADGTLGGYAGGLKLKTKLLSLEKATFKI